LLPALRPKGVSNGVGGRIFEGVITSLQHTINYEKVTG
jgi:hypothetical protein